MEIYAAYIPKKGTIPLLINIKKRRNPLCGNGVDYFSSILRLFVYSGGRSTLPPFHFIEVSSFLKM
ncbi:hypothetical protein [Desmospora profundinema]|uniref:Uncharacterized protein n=1 Tax=Desmospora profundinema TaxID=1571184 RepID=A0ABU1IKJ8_9BACL|nr:hypothetical protein [Desmospora profundinema]MDR6224928.1 hypothetical protein [Desmospora profundinema]